ncbi:MAG: hypothetical protein NZ576_12810, partial [Bacteroidia bacterium]|nr:hypothetical protein [Bacteroidia bacterium]
PLPANVSVNLQGGQPGFDSNTNSNHGAAAGAQGITLTGLVLQESNTPFAPLPKPVATAPSNVCSGGVISLSVGNIQNVSWNWSGPNGYSSSMQNPA